MNFGDRILAFAQSWLGVREQPLGSNRGVLVDTFNREAGASLGSPWCLAFAYTCIKHAAEHAEIAVPILRTASCSVLYKWAQDHHLNANGAVRPGDVGLVIGGESGHHHAVIIEKLLPLGLVQTIEGNTNLTGSPEGYGVFRRVRRRSTMDFVGVVTS